MPPNDNIVFSTLLKNNHRRRRLLGTSRRNCTTTVYVNSFDIVSITYYNVSSKIFSTSRENFDVPGITIRLPPERRVVRRFHFRKLPRFCFGLRTDDGSETSNGIFRLSTYRIIIFILPSVLVKFSNDISLSAFTTTERPTLSILKPSLDSFFVVSGYSKASVFLNSSSGTSAVR